MQNIAFIMQKGNMGYTEVINLPYGIFLSLLKHFQLFELMQNPEYQKEFEKQKNLKCLKATEPDWARVRLLTAEGGKE